MTSGGAAVHDPAIEAVDLTKRYGEKVGLDGLNLTVRPGEVFGYLGPNGAGKTTTIRLLLDLLRPTSGHVSVLGLSPRRDGVAPRRRIGYLSGDVVVDGRQSVRELLDYLGNLRGGVAKERIRALLDRLELGERSRIRSLSKGNRQKVGIVQAFMHEPDLLILDEPTTGLDPLIQQRFLDMVCEAKENGQTVFMSSHVLSEVQNTADRVGIVRAGRLVAVEGVEELRARNSRRVEVRFDARVPVERFQALDGIEDVIADGQVLRCRLHGNADGLVKALAEYPVASLLSEEPDLEELFFDYYRPQEVERVA